MASDSTWKATRSSGKEEDIAFRVGIPRATCPPKIYVDRWIHEGMINGGGLDASGMRTYLFIVVNVIHRHIWKNDQNVKGRTSNLLHRIYNFIRFTTYIAIGGRNFPMADGWFTYRCNMILSQIVMLHRVRNIYQCFQGWHSFVLLWWADAI